MHGGAAARLRRPARISAFVASAIAADSTGRNRFDKIADAGAMDGNMPVRNRALVTGSGIDVVMVLECSDPDSKAMEIAKPGTLKGNAQIDIAEIHGEFVGELTARTRLVVHGTGRVSGTIRYGKLVIAEGGEITGDVKRLESAEGTPSTAPASSSAGAGVAAAGARGPLSPSAERWSN